MGKEDYVLFLKNEFSKTEIRHGFPMKHSVLYYIKGGLNEPTKSVVEYNSCTKNLWISEELTKNIRNYFTPTPLINGNEYLQRSIFIHECFSEALGLTVKNCYDVNMVEMFGF